MKISYKKLWILLAERELKKSDLRKMTKLSSGVLTRLNKGEEISLSALLTICEVLDCNIGDICDAVKNNG